MTDQSVWKMRHEALCAPFPEAAVKTTQKKGGRYQYVTARTVMNRLDEVIGPGNWSARYEVADVQTGVVKCSLTIFGVTNEDFGDPNNAVRGEFRDGQIFKEAASDALKRAAVLFGVGRYLYEPDYEEEAAGQPPGAAEAARLNERAAKAARSAAPNTGEHVEQRPRPIRAEGASENQRAAITKLSRLLGQEPPGGEMTTDEASACITELSKQYAETKSRARTP